jgi:lysophospholipase L1-like esterase
MTQPDPKVAQASRCMAHPIRRNPLTLLGGAFGALSSTFTETGLGGSAAKFIWRLAPKSQRRRELTAVLALLVAATAISANLLGGWAKPPAASPSASIVASLASADPTASDSPTPAATSVESTLPSPSPSPTASPKPKPAAKKKPAAKVYTFVALGDSLTAWPSDAPWPARLDGEDANLRLVHNAGVPGDTTAQMLARLKSDVFAYKPEVLFIMGGTNDLDDRISQATTIANLKAIIVAANAKGIRIDLMTVPPEGYSDMAAKIDSLNKAIVHLGNIYKLVVIDIHTPLSTSTGVYVPKYTSDGVHFSALGAQRVANTIYSRIHRYGF